MVILESLRQIVQDSLDTRIFVTGRSHVCGEVERKLGQAANFVLIEPTGDGIVKYLREKMRNDTTPELMSSALEADIMEWVPKICSNVCRNKCKDKAKQSYLRLIADIFQSRFLLASLHIETILRETSIARRGKKLNLVKDGIGLGDAYAATLERIKAQGGEKAKLAMATLTWICHTERPLQVDELRHALAVEIGSTNFDSENAPSLDALLGCCQGLITVDKEASVVRLIHFTVQEYLCGHPDFFIRPHSVIAEACLTYSNSPQVKNLSLYSFPGHQVMPSLHYSSRYWGTHANRDLSDHVRALALEHLNEYEDNVSAVSLLSQVLHPNDVSRMSSPPRFSGLHCASFFGIVELVDSLMNAKGCDINQGDYTGSTPLLWAAQKGHDEVVQLLLKRDDVDPNTPDKRNHTPLSWAANCGHEGVVKLLLGQKDVDPNRPDENDRTPLAWAAVLGHEEIVKLLLGRKDVDPDPLDEDNRTPLGWAAIGGHERVVKLLLGRKGVDPSHPGDDGRTPLGCAATNGHGGVVKLLLGRKDADPDRPDKGGNTPLSWAASNGHEGIVRSLLGRKDVDPNHPGEDGRTALVRAAIGGHVVLCTSRADSSLLASTSWRLKQGSTSRLEPLGDSSRLGQGSTSRLDSRLEHLGGFLADSWRLEPRVQGCHAPSRLVNNTRGMEGSSSRSLAGKMSTPIAQIRMIEHHYDALLKMDMKGLSSYYLAGKMSTPIS